MTPTLAICCVAVLAAIGAAVFDVGGSSRPKKGYGGAGGATVTIQNYTFSPALVTPGVSVTFTNLDGAPHSLTSDTAGLFDTGRIQGQGTGTFTAPTTPGNYPF